MFISFLALTGVLPFQTLLPECRPQREFKRGLGFLISSFVVMIHGQDVRCWQLHWLCFESLLSVHCFQEADDVCVVMGPIGFSEGLFLLGQGSLAQVWNTVAQSRESVRKGPTE